MLREPPFYVPQGLSDIIQRMWDTILPIDVFENRLPLNYTHGVVTQYLDQCTDYLTQDQMQDIRDKMAAATTSGEVATAFCNTIGELGQAGNWQPE